MNKVPHGQEDLLTNIFLLLGSGRPRFESQLDFANFFIQDLEIINTKLNVLVLILNQRYD